MTRWEVYGSRPAYRSEWLEVWLDEVELPDGERIEHHVLRFPRASVGAVVVADGKTLLLWRHRFITDMWGWEIPAGWAEPGEDPAAAAAREVEEETGYRAGSVEPLLIYHPISGIGAMRYELFLATEPARTGGAPDGAESTRLEWVPLSEVPALARAGQIVDGPSLTALSYYLATAGG